MNLETKITIYKFTPQLFTLTHKNTQSYILGCKKGCKSRKCLIYTLYCGETGIRTPGTSRYNGFQDRRNRPLCHLSKTSFQKCFLLKALQRYDFILNMQDF